MLNERQVVANEIFSHFHFGHNLEVEGDDGWESVTPGCEMSKKVYLRDIDTPDSDTFVAVMTVVFENNNATPVEAYALLLSNGNFIGDTLHFRAVEA